MSWKSGLLLLGLAPRRRVVVVEEEKEQSFYPSTVPVYNPYIWWLSLEFYFTIWGFASVLCAVGSEGNNVPETLISW